MEYICILPNLVRKLGKGGEWELIPRGYYMITLHLIALHGFYSLLTLQIPWQYAFSSLILVVVTGIGVSAGAHRLFSHKSYKASTPLRIFLMITQTFTGQSSLYAWAKHHRLHHKFCETEGDPVNASRGFFFTHIGWVLIKESPLIKEKEKLIDVSDLHNDPVVMFQDRYLKQLAFLLTFFLPTIVPYYLWGPSLLVCTTFNIFRYIVSFHMSCMGNSVAHTWTRKPYEKSIGSADVPWLSLLILGEGWHNFHHVFPWDYRSTDYGLRLINPTTVFIETMAKLGLASDLKTVSDSVVKKRTNRTGDGSYVEMRRENAEINETSSSLQQAKADTLRPTETESKSSELTASNNIMDDFLMGQDIGPGPWGWGDQDIPVADVLLTKIEHNSFKKAIDESWKEALLSKSR